VQSLRGKQEDRRVKAQDGYLPSSYTGASRSKTRSLPVSKSRTWPHRERERGRFFGRGRSTQLPYRDLLSTPSRSHGGGSDGVE
jgi:hypothetical protein